ncbi:toll/interleukin-1 receptor domain-containing protein [Oceanospirillum beijerinckii]|uniref:toll/interleukin-1 receptor domain-containing protein n=1 Tax=Oceanospirillum beijerinckii TaxID=64976 RepID=UPI000484D3EC|nr:toll/interleukin-1 receptor domain-containing protein [Oceanospirillum beijerinckii]
MSIFISYSHQDEGFVSKLAGNLVNSNAHVWVDKWNLNVGDSILDKVQNAIEESSALIVILSESSVSSEWCKKELNSALMRELDEKRVIILPVVIDDCKIPVFLREKMYADFRGSFDQGFSSVMDAIAKVTNPNQSRMVHDNYHVDWGMDWGEYDGRFTMEFTLVEQAKEAPYTVLTQVTVFCNEEASQRYEEYCDLGLDWYGRFIITSFMSENIITENIKLLLKDSTKEIRNMSMVDKKSLKRLDVVVTSRRLGEDTGKDILINVSSYIGDIHRYVKSITRDLNNYEKEKLLTLPTATQK